MEVGAGPQQLEVTASIYLSGAGGRRLGAAGAGEAGGYVISANASGRVAMVSGGAVLVIGVIDLSFSR